MDPMSLPDPCNASADRPPCCGPYQRPPVEFIPPTRRTAMLQAALDGVELGGWDRRILTHLATWCDTPAFLAVLGWIQRARLVVDRQLADLAGEYALTKGHFSDYAAEAILTRHRLEQARDEARGLARALHRQVHDLGGLPVATPAWIGQPTDADAEHADA
jgi:hypothetical protein